MAGIRIDALPTTVLPSNLHAVPAMADGLSVQLSVQQIIDLAKAQILDGAPEALDTLNELAAALNDDANFAASITASIAAISSAVVPGIGGGFTLSNNVSAPDTDIDIAPGVIPASDGSGYIKLTSSLTKRLSQPWAVGDGEGGLDTGSVSNGTYFLHAIKRSDTGVVDAVFSTSGNAPTMPVNYDKHAYLGGVLREGGSLIAFKQINRYFYRDDPVRDFFDSSVPTSNQTVGLSVPEGRQVGALVVSNCVNGAYNFYLDLYTPGRSNQSPSHANGNYRSGAQSGDVAEYPAEHMVWTDTNAQIGYRASSQGELAINCLGWYDPFGEQP
ncbi:MAG: hypothetical protein A49_27810 [Methyloceanibacter sp.]|nr:MAG: hypothetical protein A49_27810 [Methyloceanibacter sp.]